MMDTEGQFDESEILLRFTPLPPHPSEKHPDCADEYVIVKIADDMPGGMMVYARYGEKWEANPFSVRPVIRWFMAEREIMLKGHLQLQEASEDARMELKHKVRKLESEMEFLKNLPDDTLIDGKTLSDFGKKALCGQSSTPSNNPAGTRTAGIAFGDPLR